MADCLFCKIVSGDIPGAIVYRDEHLVAFKDINPQAPLHVLIVPRRHIATLNDLVREDDDLVGEMVRCAAAIARQTAAPTGAIARCSTATPRPVSRCSTFTCTCWAGAR